MKIFFRKYRRLIVLGCLIVVFSIGLHLYLKSIGIGWAPGTGFGPYIDADGKLQRGKTLWDWMELLIIPIVLALGALLFNRQEKLNDKKIAEQRNQEQVFQNYLDKMNELMLEKGLIKISALLKGWFFQASNTSEDSMEEQIPDDLRAVRDMARTRTITALRQLNQSYRDTVTQFLRDSDLANFVLVGANLDSVDLSNTNLSRLNLQQAILTNALLTRAILYKTDFKSADLSGAHLATANMEYADLRNAKMRDVDLRQANLRGAFLDDADMLDAHLNFATLLGATLRGAIIARADLSGANLSDADLYDVHGNEAILRGASLINANLTNSIFCDEADLSGAVFFGAVLKGANLKTAKLYQTDLTRADLTNAKGVTEEQLSYANLEDTVLPDGSKRTSKPSRIKKE